MAEKILTHITASEGGLQTQFSALTLGRPEYNGFASTLINFEPGKGYRRISGFSQFNSAGTGFGAGSNPVVGVAIYNDRVFAAKKLSSTTYRIYHSATTGNWSDMSGSDVTITDGFKVRHCLFNWGGEKVAFVDGTNPAVTWNGSAVVVLNGAGSPTNPKYVATFKNRLILAGYTSKPYAVSISAPNDETTWSGSGAIEINVGDTITQIRGFRDSLYFFCENSIKKLIGSTSADFEVVPVTFNLGCLAPDSLIEIGGDLYFWSTDGFRPIQATDRIGDVNLGTITIPIRPTIRDILEDFNPVGLVALTIKNKSQFRLFFSDSATSDTYVRGIIGVLNSGAVQAQPHWEFGELKGMNPACGISDYIAGVEYVLHGTWNGVVMRQESGNTFNGTAIQAVYRTPYMDLKDPCIRKTILKLHTYLELEGDATLYIQVYYDFNDPDIIQPTNYSKTYDYGVAIYDDPDSLYGGSDTVYGGNASPRVITDIQGSGKVVSIQIVSIDNQPSFAVQGFVLEHTEEGRA